MGGGSSLGYKRAGFDVIGNVEIDPRMNDIYVENNHPRFNYCEDLREFNKRDLPKELYEIEILDGSPPCTSFSTVGIRERGWGKVKKFKEGQVSQTLDDLFFVFLDTVELMRPKIVVAENVVGIVKGKAKGYVNIVLQRLKDLGYETQIFALNSAYMDVPQARHRVFFIANRCGYKKLKMDFDHEVIRFGDVRTAKGKPYYNTGIGKTLLDNATRADRSMADVAARLSGETNKYFSHIIVHDEQVCPTITSGGMFLRFCDKTRFADDDYRNVQTFPQDYNFKGQNEHYVCGMSVPPNMMANVAEEIWRQWLN